MEEVLKSWDIETTEKHLKGLETRRAERIERERKLKQAAEDE